VKFLVFFIVFIFEIHSISSQLANELSSTSGSPIPPPATGCSNSTSCSDCISSVSCLWCEGNSKCVDGQWYGVYGSSSCSDWRWKQCYLGGVYVLYGSAGFVLLVFIVCICVCICCCCCRKKEKTSTRKTSFVDTEPLINSHPKTDQRREYLSKKYGGNWGSSTA